MFNDTLNEYYNTGVRENRLKNLAKDITDNIIDIITRKLDDEFKENGLENSTLSISIELKNLFDISNPFLCNEVIEQLYASKVNKNFKIYIQDEKVHAKVNNLKYFFVKELNLNEEYYKVASEIDYKYNTEIIKMIRHLVYTVKLGCPKVNITTEVPDEVIKVLTETLGIKYKEIQNGYCFFGWDA